MKLFDLIFSPFSRNARTRVKMDLTLASSTRLLSRIRRLARNDKKAHKLVDEGLSLLKTGAEVESFDDVVNGFHEFLKGYVREAEALHKISRYVHTEEYRLENRLKKYLDVLSSINSSDETIKRITADLSKLLSEIHAMVVRERQLVTDVYRDREKLRDKSVLPFFLIYRRIRKAARHGRSEARHLKKLFKAIDETIYALQKGDAEASKKAYSEITQLFAIAEKEVLEEFRDLVTIEQAVVVLETRESEIINKIKEIIGLLERENFPEKAEQELISELKEVWNEIHNLERDDRSATNVLKKAA